MLAALAALLAVAACSGTRETVHTVTEEVTVTVPAGEPTTTADEEPAPGSPLTPEEAEWMTVFTEESDRVSTNIEVLKTLDVDLLIAGDEDELTKITGANAEIATCDLATATDAPTERTAELADVYAEACGHLSEAVAYFDQAVSIFLETGEVDADAFKRAADGIGEASPLLGQAYEMEAALYGEELPPEPPAEPPVEPDPDADYTSVCDYLLGDFSDNTRTGYRFVADADITNTGNIGIVVRVNVSWRQIGTNPVKASKTAKIKVGSSKTVHITEPATGDEILAHQSADSRCKVAVLIVDTFGEPVER
jgi:hypothetical protein